MRKFLVCISIFVVFCAKGQKTITGLEKTYLSNFSKLSYKSKISFYKKSFTGILLVKRDGEEVRIGFVTEFGIKIFELFFNGTKFQKIYCNEYLDKKPVISALEKDFRSLFVYPDFRKEKHKKNGEIVTVSKTDRFKIKHRIDTNHEIQKSILLKNNIRKVIVRDYQYNDRMPIHMKVKHKVLGLSLEFNSIDL